MGRGWRKWLGGALSQCSEEWGGTLAVGMVVWGQFCFYKQYD